MLNERNRIAKELDEIIYPFVRNNHPKLNKKELYFNPDMSLNRLSEAEQWLEKLHEIENNEDKTIVKQKNRLEDVLS
ncbi:MAG: hypothetical protein J07AB43_09050 [Candidatus Nanosalina sp. J07AB43]|jgi:hypothetical protein|nr:MAG: hypothetical protein J07AB43_09050 [Candidatus Nanosalina sp. J07AB43]